jgi:protoporphyrinogen oxidase
MVSPDRPFVVIGAGPAGLTAAYQLSKYGLKPVVVEAAHAAGGLARTESYKGYHFDMGGHRFFTKSKEVEQFWHEILQEDFLHRPRLSRIYYKKRFFHYPIKALNALAGLGCVEGARIILSYLRWSLFPYQKEETFDHWVTNRFGKRLFEIFFKTYTEKVWGIPCSELRAEWAAQRIKDLSLKTALVRMFFRPRGSTIRTLIESFEYPRLGPGMLWRAVQRRLEQRGATVHLRSEVVAIHRTGNRVDSITVRQDGGNKTIEGTDFISSMPITALLEALDPPPPLPVLQASRQLKYRDFLTVCLIVNRPQLFPDNWIYIHEPEVRVGRIQNFKNWSSDMVPDPGSSSLGLEYFCNEGDDLWQSPDAELIEQAKQELAHLGLAEPADVVDGCVFRVPKSYPVYDSAYRDILDVVKNYITSLENFQTIGRNGLHRYNNQDHAMLSGMLAVRNALLEESHDLWCINADQEYQEEIRAETVSVLGQGMAGDNSGPQERISSVPEFT